MHRLIPTTAACLLMIAAITAQATLTGVWQGTTGRGAAITLDLTAKGTELTGALTRGDVKAEISRGRITQTAFSFTATLNEQTEAFEGKLDGDRLEVWLQRQGRESAIVLKRVTPQPRR